MKLHQLCEMSYEGNIGIMEMIKFYAVATSSEKIEMKRLIADQNNQQAWELLKRVTNVDLK